MRSLLAFHLRFAGHRKLRKLLGLAELGLKVSLKLVDSISRRRHRFVGRSALVDKEQLSQTIRREEVKLPSRDHYDATVLV